MSARLLLEVAIRVIGLWLVFTTISGLPTTALLILPVIWSTAPPSSLLPSIIAFGVSIIVQGVFGALLAWWAPWIASRFYARGSEEVQVHLAVGPGDVYRIACFVLGVYLLVHTTEPASRLAATLIQGTPANWRLGQGVADSVATVVYAATGIVLIFGSRRIGEMLSHLRYDPDTIPKQQISLAILLSLVVLFALILGAIRWLTVGGV
jgi:hypothetical protein